ncbi:MAG: delta-aminolevulinic acid dehydratase [Muribaculaceae bacterium]|nr:delta-aminolevulinic acid dehydratase [Muribaculaceae bacterium]
MGLLISSLLSLKEYCEREQFKGWDPYDGLNSKLLMSIPILKNQGFYRLAVIQLFKRNPINLRQLALIPKDYNAKGVGLLLQGYCNLYDAVSKNKELAKTFGSPDELKKQIVALATLLLSLQSQGDYHGACWGYNFDWQARLLFLFPKNTPTVVATCFSATALISAYEITKKQEYLDVALSSAQFVINDLHRTSCDDGFLFSYSPLQGNDTVYNASLLGSKLLSYCYHYTGNEEYKELARESVLACCKGQQHSGAWVYGMLPVQRWVDSFHTGYNLDALCSYQKLTGDKSFDSNIEIGLDYYISNFFEQDGCPKYYDNKKYPIDIHCPAQLFVTLYRLGLLDVHNELIDNILNWTIKNMQSPKGYFYYQLKPGISSKISYMRWSNAFMFYALTFLLNGKNIN